jgi:hypothetical protein
MGVRTVDTVVDLQKRVLLHGLIIYRFGSGETSEFWEKQNAFGDWEPITDRNLEESLDRELELFLSLA